MVLLWTKLNLIHPRMLCAKFGWNWLSGSGEEDFLISSLYFLYFVIISPRKRVGPFIWTKLNPLHPRILCAKFGWNCTGWNLTFQSTERWLNGGWMATEWWRERWISVAFQPPFSQLNGRYISVTFQSAYFLENKITPNAARTRDVRIKGKVR